MSETIVQEIPGYRLGEPIGSGPRGTVFRAETLAGAPAAVKLLNATAADDDALRARVAIGAATTFGEPHPHLAAIYDWDELSGRPYVVGELFPAGSLAARLAGGPLPLAAACDLAAQAAAGLAELHARGVMHGDVKPTNLLLVERPASAAGFRLAVADAGHWRGVETLLAEDSVDVELAYCAPEWFEDASLGPAADSYALGAVLFAMLAGRPPFIAGDLDAAFVAHVYQAPPALAELRPEVPAELAALITRCLAKSPEERPSCAELAAALPALGAPSAAAAAPEGARPSPPLPAASPLGLGADRAGLGFADAPPPPPTTPAEAATPAEPAEAPAAPTTQLAPAEPAPAEPLPAASPTGRGADRAELGFADAPLPPPPLPVPPLPAGPSEPPLSNGLAPHPAPPAEEPAAPAPAPAPAAEPAEADEPPDDVPPGAAAEEPQSAPTPEPAAPAETPAEPEFVAIPAAARVGELLEGCRLEELLGSNEVGSVFRALQISLGRRQVLKIFHPHLAADPAFRERVLREAEAVARLRHPGVVEVYEVAARSGRLYLSMELMREGSLRGLLQRRARAEQGMPLGQVIDLLRQAADGLAAAHERAIVHGNIKPSNLLLTPASRGGMLLKLADFGLTPTIDEVLALPESHIADILAYAGPEWFEGRRPTDRYDVYSLGVVLYEVSTGYLPFEARDFDVAYLKHVSTQPLPPRQVRPDLPADLEALILRCLAKAPADRPSAGELAEALRELAQSPALSPAPPPAGGPSGVAVGPARIPRVQALDQNGQTIRVIELTGDGLSVGRLPDNDLVLEAETIAGRHLQIDWDGSRVSVLSLSEHTALEGQRLAPQTLQSWGWGTMLRLGPYWLRLEQFVPGAPAGGRGTARLNGEHPPAPAEDLDAPAPSPTAPARPAAPVLDVGRISVVALERTLKITPSRPTSFEVALANLGKQVDHLTVTVEGVPEHWLAGTPPVVQLNPGAQGVATLGVQVPMVAESRAGDYQVTIRATSRENPDESNTVAVTWTVLPFRGYSLALQPRRGRAWWRSSYTALARNTGNAEASCALSASDDEELLNYRFAEDQLTLPPGGARRVKLRVANRQLRWFGSEQRHNFSVQLRPEAGSGEPVSAAGQLEQTVLLNKVMLWAAAALTLIWTVYAVGFGRIPRSFAFGGVRASVPLHCVLCTPTRTPTPLPTLTPRPTATIAPSPTIAPTEPPPPTLAPTDIPPPTRTPTVPPPTSTPTITLTPTSRALCRPGDSLELAGFGPPNTAYLVYYDGRAVGGGTTDRGGFFRTRLQLGRERPGERVPVSVRVRETGQELRLLDCIVPAPPTRTAVPLAPQPTTPTAP